MNDKRWTISVSPIMGYDSTQESEPSSTFILFDSVKQKVMQNTMQLWLLLMAILIPETIQKWREGNTKGKNVWINERCHRHYAYICCWRHYTDYYTKALCIYSSTSLYKTERHNIGFPCTAQNIPHQHTHTVWRSWCTQADLLSGSMSAFVVHMHPRAKTSSIHTVR